MKKLAISCVVLVALTGCETNDESKKTEPNATIEKPTIVKPPEKKTAPKVEKVDDEKAKPKGFIAARFSESEIPKDAKFKGAVVSGLRWADKNGDNFLVLSRDPKTGVRDTKQTQEVWLYANHFSVKDGTTNTLREVKQLAPCDEGDLNAEFRKAAEGLTDLDSDGVAEATFAYAYTCTTDVSPQNYKLLMLENDEKYILRGYTKVDAGGGDIIGGKFKVDESFKGHDAFLQHAKSVWNKTKQDTY